MALARALLCAALFSQVSMAVAKHPDFESSSTIACMSRKAGCTCAELGAVDDTTAGKSCGRGTEAKYDYCSNCCKAGTTETCYTAFMKNEKMCGDTMELDVAKLTTAAGATADVQKSNCCKAPPKKTCSQITCTNRRRSKAGFMKAKAGVAATECTDAGSCDSKCCEVNTATCGGNALSSDMSRQVCGSGNHSDYFPKAYATTDKTTCEEVVTTAGAATFTDSASFRSACCDAKAGYSTCSSVTCAAGWKKKDPMPAAVYKCAGTACKASECCEKLTTTTSCSASCDVGSTVQYVYDMATAVCGNPTSFTLAYCKSAKCDAATQVLDYTKEILDKASPTDADIKATCCVNKPAETKPAEPAKCSAFFDASNAEAMKTTGGANTEKASFSILVAAAILSVKLFAA